MESIFFTVQAVMESVFFTIHADMEPVFFTFQKAIGVQWTPRSPMLVLVTRKNYRIVCSGLFLQRSPAILNVTPAAVGQLCLPFISTPSHPDCTLFRYPAMIVNFVSNVL
jgi:hypothetical protein